MWAEQNIQIVYYFDHGYLEVETLMIQNNPIMTFIVVKVMIGNANVTPIIIP
jgi:hypothetical protein